MHDVKRLLTLGALGAASLGLLGSAHADETPFAYTYTTETLPQGHWEYEQWNTIRAGKASGGYTSFDLDQEIEHGFTDHFQASFYLHSSFLHTHNTPDPDDASTSLKNQNAFDINGVSVELKYRLLSAEKDPIGLSLYAEPELGVRDPLTGEDDIERSVETKLLVDKHLLDDRLILAANVVFEPEWEREDGEHSKELKNETLLAASYRVASRWSAGLEFINRRKFDDQNFGQQSESAFFLGPALHYADQRGWASFTVLPQIAGNPNPADSHLALGEYEKLDIRLKVGVEF